MRQYPEPFVDIQGGEEGRKPGYEIEVGERVVKKFGEPDFPVGKLAREMGYLLRLR